MKGDVRAVASVEAGAVVEFVFVEGGFRLPVPPGGFNEVMAERRLM